MRSSNSNRYPIFYGHPAAAAGLEGAKKREGEGEHDDRGQSVPGGTDAYGVRRSQ